MIHFTNSLEINTTFFPSTQTYASCELNGTKFAFFLKPLSEVNLDINLKDYIIVILAPLEGEQALSVQAISILALATLTAIKGKAKIHTTEKVVLFGKGISSSVEIVATGVKRAYSREMDASQIALVCEKIKEGFAEKKGPLILDTLFEIYAAVVGCSKENSIDHTQAYEFYQIPLILKTKDKK